jgi:3-phenylpropionate/trans-cinnamate dioxygenase ferredoxin component
MWEEDMEFIRVAETTALPAGKMMAITAGGKEILLANVDGSYYAIANKCTHLGGSLAKGVLDGGVVTCPRHGAQFDVKTGQAVSEAKIAFVKMRVRNEVKYEVKIEGTDILVGLP